MLTPGLQTRPSNEDFPGGQLSVTGGSDDEHGTAGKNKEVRLGRMGISSELEAHEGIVEQVLATFAKNDGAWPVAIHPPAVQAIRSIMLDALHLICE